MEFNNLCEYQHDDEGIDTSQSTHSNDGETK